MAIIYSTGTTPTIWITSNPTNMTFSYHYVGVDGGIHHFPSITAYNEYQQELEFQRKELQRARTEMSFESRSLEFTEFFREEPGEWAEEEAA